MGTANYDFIVVGAGIVGLSIAREIRLRKLGSVLVVEKEPQVGLHSSGRNSGVLHSGIYYPPGTLKAKLCVRGAQLLRNYITTKKLKHNRCGKVIVAQSKNLADQVSQLLHRAHSNGVECHLLDTQGLNELEPLAFSHGSALHSPNTWVFDPIEVMHQILDDLKQLGAHVLLDQRYESYNPLQKHVKTDKSSYGCSFLINASGLWADVVAHSLNVGLNYSILPFRGSYKTLVEPIAGEVRGLIYPVPDMNLPFLGVHITRGIHGQVSVGPTAMPALGREHYSPQLTGLDMADFLSILKNLSKMILANRNNLRRHIIEEIKLHSMFFFENRLQQIAPQLTRHHLAPSKKCGLRAQLINTLNGQLEMDFVIEKGERSMHVLNAVSPAFSSALAFAEHVCDSI